MFTCCVNRVNRLEPAYCRSRFGSDAARRATSGGR
jgi:hypothetical protein